MSALVFIISVVALIFAIVAFRRTGGMTEIKDDINSLDSITNSFRERTANALEKMENVLRKEEKEEDAEKKEGEYQ
ncbi:MAG: hypothetical protein SWO11_09420 [Thermodesulfobacteriota bacterium]|nr:hypothetical protein [Thermodesulfobacteriota bacterium]